MKKAIRSHWASVFMSLIILLLCNIPQSATGNVAGFFFEGMDKLVHLGLFFLLAACLIIGERIRTNQNSLMLLPLFFIFLICAFYGGLIEMIQHYITNRTAELWDLIADCLGAMMAISFYYVIDLLGPNKQYSQKV